MTLQQLQNFTFLSKYARFRPELKRRETYEESVTRVFAMHEQRYGGKGVDEEIAYAKSAALDRLVLGSQRALQFGGKPILDKHARLYNCTVSYCDRPRFFQESLWLLLCGSGVGFSVQRHHVAKLPKIQTRNGPKLVWQIQDSIEGWADALGALMSSYFEGDGQPFPEVAGNQLVFDYSLIRPKGAPLSSGSGKAPGPEPLRRSLEKIQTLLDCVLADSGSPLSMEPIHCYDIIMHASDAVLSGGVRRSATICIFSPDDDAMVKAKTGDWFDTNPQRGRSNNSAMLIRDKTSFEDFSNLMQSVKQFGEPGFVWSDSTEIMYNPCVEIGMLPAISVRDYLDAGWGEDNTADRGRGMDEMVSGWAFCNLCEINVKACSTPDIFERACRAAAIIGTLQAGYTSFPYLGSATEAIVRKEALLGCSMTGMMDNPKIAFDPEIQQRMAKLILEVNAKLAPKIGINPTARATCIKPAGTTSCMLGTASGIHPHHAKRYFRRVQANALESPAQYFRLHNPRAAEHSVWNPNGTDLVLTFCVEVPEEARTKNMLTAVELLKIVKLTQENWVNAGRNAERCAAPWLRHNVSNTITVMDNEWGDVTRFIFDNREAFAGISLLSDGGDMDYPQAPFCAVWTHDEIVKEYGVGSLMASGLIVDGLHAFSGDLWAACACALGTGQKLDVPHPEGQLSDDQWEQLRKDIKVLLGKKDWVRRAHKFAANYFDGDLRRMTYCLKRVNNCKLWADLQREYVPVDYTLLVEETDNTRLAEAQACSGGKCEL